MKQVVKSKSVSTVKSNDTVGMKIDSLSIKSILNVLTDIYPDPDLAALREYPTNALDSHIDAGQTRPIEITLPSSFDPRLKVQDWGLGMGRYELTEIYGVYGRSTKRETNDTLGSFGLGSKSALASVDAFQLISVKDGKKFNVLIDKDVEGVGQLNILSETDTDEPNGVTVLIPVPSERIDSFEEKANDLFLLWEPGTVLVNGKKPRALTDIGYHKIEDLGYVAYDTRSYRNVRVAMGGLIYNVDGLDYAKTNTMFKEAYALQYKNIIVNADIGDVTISPARESILSNDENLRYVRKRITAMYEYLVKNAEADINAAKDPFEAMSIIRTFDFLNIKKPSYNGVEYATFKETYLEAHMWKAEQGRRNRMNGYNGKFNLEVSPVAKKSILFDTSVSKAVAADLLPHLNMIRRMYPDYATGHNFLIGDFSETRKDIFVDSMVKNGLITVVDADKAIADAIDFRKSNRKKAVSSGPRGSLTYPVYVHDGTNVDTDNLTLKELRELNTVHVYQPSTTGAETRVIQLFTKHGKDGDVFVLVSKNRSLESLTTRLSEDVEVLNAAKEIGKAVRKDFEKVYTGNEALYHHILSSYQTSSFLRLVKIVKAEIDSPLLREIVDYDPSKVADVRDRNAHVRSHLSWLGLSLTDKENEKFFGAATDMHVKVEEFTKFFEMFLSLGNVHSDRTQKHSVMFLNTLYKAEGDPTL